ncbi:DUF1048 domain-containing protein [Lacticaseibacillus kribbianus]|uniref:DUF1048 domain-containing protein n=1 Tax=Lacticaseibacillus kribbianus TaxID=2926292 RepID=UPI001CD532C2|nr:DUF1048 domain-containing protein [Lacticaseibacillus kribbianus]
MSLIEDKRAWRAHAAAVHALPHDYEVVYKEIQKYLLKVTAPVWADQFARLQDLLALFEAGAARGEDVLAVTGPDVAAFADGLI